MKALVNLICLIFLLSSCDLIHPKKKFKLAIATDDESYLYAGNHLKLFLEQGEFQIEVINVENAIAANEMVARGDADLTFVRNHSLFIPEVLQEAPANLRTLLPLYTNLMLLYSREELDLNGIGQGELGVEVMDGEAFLDLYEIFKLTETQKLKIAKDGEGDLIYFWGNLYEDRSKKLIAKNWKMLGLTADWEQFLLLNNPGLRRFRIPAIPGVRNSKTINTMASETLLVCSSSLGANTIYDLSQYIIQYRLRLTEQDRMYRIISENFSKQHLLYPLHLGTEAFLRRDKPTFFATYSKFVALLFTLFAVVYAAFQTMKIRLLNQRKDWADQYYLDFLLVKESDGSEEVKRKRYDALLGRALTYMTKRKISKKDFHTLSRLIQDEQSNLR